MVSRMLLHKLLHCRRQRRKNAKVISPTSSQIQDELANLKTEENIDVLMLTPSVYSCRVCLKEGKIPLFSENLTLEDLADNLSVFANIIISPDDDYPKYLCSECHSLLEGAVLLRKTAQRSLHLLEQDTKQEVIENSITVYNTTEQDDRIDVLTDVSDETTPLRYTKKVDNKDYSCLKCNMNFKSLKEITRHRKSLEHKNTKYECPVCNKEYSSYYYRKHMAIHKCETPYICDVCGKKFIIQGQFTRHRLTHFYDLPFQCAMCPYRGRFSESLKMHMRTHTGEKPYQCPDCPKRCINKSNLNRHMQTHKKEYRFNCDTCGRGFYTKRELELHFKVDHSGIKDHICNICDKAFGYRKQMMKHQLKVHKRDKLQSGRLPLYLQVERKKHLEELTEH